MSAGGVDFGLGSSQGQAHSKTLVIRYSTVHIRYTAVYNIRNYVTTSLSSIISEILALI